MQIYGWIDQAYNRIYTYNNRLSGARKIGAIELTLTKVSERCLGVTTVTQTPDGLDVTPMHQGRWAE